MNKKKTYDELLNEAQGLISKDVETKFKIAKILQQMNQFKSQGEIARDLQWKIAEISTYIRVYEVWGDRRIPSGLIKDEDFIGQHWVREATWANYTFAIPRGMSENDRNEYIEACLKYGPDGPAREMRRKRIREAEERAQKAYEEEQRKRQERIDARAKMSAAEKKAESAKYNAARARWLDEQLRRVVDHYVPMFETDNLGDEARQILDKLYDDIVVQFANLGIVELPSYLKAVS